LFAATVHRFWWIKVKALAQSRNWPELEKFAKSKKPPIGFEVSLLVGCLACVEEVLLVFLSDSLTAGNFRGVGGVGSVLL
jgi:hypothetical protein